MDDRHSAVKCVFRKGGNYNMNTMDTIRLRKLTLKSVWDLTAKYKNWTVEKILHYHPSTIYWAYCKLEKVTFSDDVLDQIRLRFDTFKEISKPGIDLEQFQLFFTGGYQDMSLEKLRNLIKAKKANGQNVPASLIQTFKRKKFLLSSVRKNKYEYTKASLQGKNHGRTLL